MVMPAAGTSLTPTGAISEKISRDVASLIRATLPEQER
jgi:hypothetical protein